MATLERFRLLATQCGVAPSPTRSPRTSPVVHVRRQKTTLRMLFSRTTGPRDKPAEQRKFVPASPSEGGGTRFGRASGHTLKDLFGGCPPRFEESDLEAEEEMGRKRSSNVMGGGGGGLGLGVGVGVGGLMVGPGSPRPPGFMRLRYRTLLRKAWRPVLETIPECE